MSDDLAPRTTRLSTATYLRHLRADSARFAAVLAGVPPSARVPACPDWDADDLLWHLADVQWFWTQVVSTRPAGPPEDHPDRPSDRAALQAAFAAWSAELADALDAAGGTGVDLFARPCTFLGTHPESGRTFDGPHVLHVADPGRAPEATITGRAGDVDAWLWKRHGDAAVEQAGDADVLARFHAAVSPPLD